MITLVMAMARSRIFTQPRNLHRRWSEPNQCKLTTGPWYRHCALIPINMASICQHLTNSAVWAIKSVAGNVLRKCYWTKRRSKNKRRSVFWIDRRNSSPPSRKRGATSRKCTPWKKLTRRRNGKRRYRSTRLSSYNTTIAPCLRKCERISKRLRPSLIVGGRQKI